jgi:hypothetical protein
MGILMKMRFVAVCIAFACLYGVLHDQVTARICLEYFTVWHPPLVNSQDPTVVALAWGIVATWWVGLLLGIPLAFVCRAGRRLPLSVREVLPLLGWLFLGMTICAVLAGVVGYLFAPESLAALNRYDGPNKRGFVTNLFTHNASYLSGTVGGAMVIFAARIKRMKRGYAA